MSELLEELHLKFRDMEKVTYTKQNGRLAMLPEIKAALPFIEELYGDVPNAIYTFCIKNRIFHKHQLPKCEVDSCYEFVKVKSGNKGFSHICSEKCRRELAYKKSKETMNERYGVDTPLNVDGAKEKYKATSIKNYGTEHPMLSEEYMKEYAARNIEKHGVKSTLSIPSVRKKATKTMIERFGVDNAMKNPEIVQKQIEITKQRFGIETDGHHLSNPEYYTRTIVAGMQRKYGERHYMINATDSVKNRRRDYVRGLPDDKKEEIHLKRKETIASKKKDPDRYLELVNISKEEINRRYQELGAFGCADYYGVAYQTFYEYLKKFNIELTNDNRTSKEEKLLTSYIRELGFDVIENDRTILNGLELDIFIPEKKIAIEYNGVHWHSTQFIQDRNYHLKKYEMCCEKGVRLVSLFCDEFRRNPEIIKTKIASLLGVSPRKRVPARKTQVFIPKVSDVTTFYQKYHIQQSTAATHHLGLEYDGTMVACMSFYARPSQGEGHYELVRFATSCDVVGGFSKLLKAFIRRMEPTKITSFADLRISDGNVYFKNGFNYVSQTKPNYYYVKNGKRYRKNGFKRKNIENYFYSGKFEFFDPELSESKNMEMNGYHQIFDIGLLKFELDCTQL